MLEGDIKFHEDKAKLTEDGFCPLCSEYYDQCNCIGFWIRRSTSFASQQSSMIQDKKDISMRVKQILEYQCKADYTTEECWILLTESLKRALWLN